MNRSSLAEGPRGVLEAAGASTPRGGTTPAEEETLRRWRGLLLGGALSLFGFWVPLGVVIAWWVW